ncbi:alpha-amylase, partial [Terriglobus sp. YAF25]
GDGDKCFGVTAMMATLPGLPMFGHGQIDGFTEKYGMEYRRPRYDETPNHWLVERHEREIAPLLHQRALFAESSNFLLYDFFNDNGTVDENVFAYSNRRGDQRGLVLYNNRYSTTKGTVDWSAAYADKHSGQLRQQRLKDGLGLSGDPAIILRYRDSLTGLEYLRRALNTAEHGLRIELRPYQCHVFLDWREMRATADKPWDRLCDELNGRGVANLEDELINLALRPAHDALRRLLDPALVRTLSELSELPQAARGSEKQKNIERQKEEFLETAWVRSQEFLLESQLAYRAPTGEHLAVRPTNPALLAEKFHKRVRAAMDIPALESLFPTPWNIGARRLLPSLIPELIATAIWGPVLSWCVLELLAESIDAQKPERAALDLFDRLRLREPLAHSFSALGFEGEESWRATARIKVALLAEAEVTAPETSSTTALPERVETALIDSVTTPAIATGAAPAKAPGQQKQAPPTLSQIMWHDADVRWLTGVHEANGRTYFVKESYEELIWWLQLPVLRKLAGKAVPDRSAIVELSKAIKEALEAATSAGYRLDVLLGNDKPEAEA